VIASRCDWYQLKGLLKGFKLALKPWKSLKKWWRYGRMKFVTGFLRVVIGPDGIEMKKEKVDGVLGWPQPKNVKDVRKFLGLANYYRRFIKDFARIARPMNTLTRKDIKWQWGQEQQ